MKITDLPGDLLADRPHLFSSVPVAIAPDDLVRMQEVITAIERVVALPAWSAHTKVGAGGTAAGVFMGYDFHLTPDGPQLIEINTNAGGGVLAALQAGRDDVLAAFVAMFRAECPHELKTIAIIDENPVGQYLYPEFLVFQMLLEANGIRTVICDPTDLMHCHGSLWSDEETRIDLAYNRLTDFDLTHPKQAALREAWLSGAAIVTPNPALHARYADKRNLVALTDEALLTSWGVDAATRAILQGGIPRTENVTVERAEEFWQRRRQLFFKPALGFGSRAAYRGDKLTKRVFDEILAGDYVAQGLALPSTVPADVAGATVVLKADVRNYVYRGSVQFVAARLYQGQTTNFRTPGGGFAKVMTN